jgi:phosphoribosylglycinamide formyltransferase-1
VENKSHKNLVLFASGNGSNALNIIRYFKANPNINVKAVFCNNPKAKVLEKAIQENVPTFVFTKQELNETDVVLEKLKDVSADVIILAGFLLKIPGKIIESFSDRIINIHPALLPKYGGKGMYGMHVHQAVVEHKERETGITIHYVNENYDEGAIIFQEKCAVSEDDSPEDVAEKIHALEMKYFPKVLHDLLKSKTTKSSFLEK